MFFDLRLLEDGRLAAAHDLEPRGVEGPRVEQILLPILRRVLLQLVEERRFDREDRGPRQILRVDAAFASAARRSAASPATSPSRAGRSRPACRARISSASPASGTIDFICSVLTRDDEPVDGAELGAACDGGSVSCHSPSFFSKRVVRPLAVTSSRVDLLAIELQDGLVAQVERAAIEGRFEERGIRKTFFFRRAWRRCRCRSASSARSAACVPGRPT